jgi:hypothetical protein
MATNMKQAAEALAERRTNAAETDGFITATLLVAGTQYDLTYPVGAATASALPLERECSQLALLALLALLVSGEHRARRHRSSLLPEGVDPPRANAQWRCVVGSALHYVTVLRASCFVLRASCFVLRASCFVLRASCFVLRASCFVLRAWFSVLGSRCLVLGAWCSVLVHVCCAGCG